MILTDYQNTELVGASALFLIIYVAFRYVSTGTLSIWDAIGTTFLFFLWYLTTYAMANYLTYDTSIDGSQ